VGAVRPDVDALSTELIERLGTLWAEAAGPSVMVHGDTNVNNAILVGDRVAFIDFDRAAIGSAGSDIGNFLGLLSYGRSLGIMSSDAEGHQAAAFRRGYSSVRPLPDPASLDVHIAAALVERAFRAVSRVRARALQRVPALLAEAEGLLTPNATAR
jgi:Ser/Thr protein kinase RdoA (MazF antagonist)